MIKRFCASMLACTVVTAAAAQAPAGAPAAADSARVATIVDRARAAAGNEWGATVDFFCGDAGRANRADDPEIKPTRVFDNLYALGRTSTVVWALTTQDGILLIDAGYPDQLESVLLPQMRAAGLDDIPVVVGGIIPDADAEALRAAGVARVYTPKDFELNRIMLDIVALAGADAREAA